MRTLRNPADGRLYEEGTMVRHRAEPSLVMRIVRLERDWLGEAIAVCRDTVNSASFKVRLAELERTHG